MDLILNYTRNENINFPIPDNITIVNNLPNKIYKKLENIDIQNIISSSIDKELLFQNKKIAIVIEDFSRPNYLGDILKEIVKTLLNLGADKKLITIIAASGTHRLMVQKDFKEKIGPKLASEINCISNDCTSENFIFLGKVSGDIPLFINKHFVEADFKIIIGTLFPHDMAGFSGGAKMVFPGIANLQSITELHKSSTNFFEYSNLKISQPRTIIEEAGEKANIDLCLTLIVNKELKIIRIFTGDYIKSQRDAAKEFYKLYGVKDIEKTDVVISNCYPLGSDLYQVEKGLFPALFFAKDKKKILFIAACEEGVGIHKLVEKGGPLRGAAISYFKKLAKKYDISFYSNGVTKQQFHEYFPDFRFFNDIDKCSTYLFGGKNNSQKILSILKAAPLIAFRN